jgi:hypothetical protein
MPGAEDLMDERETPGDPEQDGFEESGRPEEGARSGLWDELGNRGRTAGERVGREWERVSRDAEEYAREHSIGVALGSLALGLVAGVLIGALLTRD